MKNKKLIQKYINNFRINISPYLKKDIGLECNIHMAKVGGAILEWKIGPTIPNNDSYKPTTQTVGRALKNIKQSAFGGNLEGFSFAGTNIVMEPNKIILIKGDETNEWSESAAENDIKRILNSEIKS